MRGDMKQMFVGMIRTMRNAINWTVAGTLLGLTGGALFGTLWGALVGLLHGEPWMILSAEAYFALWGATAGGLVGAYRGIFDRREAYSGGNSAGEARPVRKPSTSATAARDKARFPNRAAAPEGEEDLQFRTTGVAAVIRERKTRPHPDRERYGRGEPPQ